MLYDRKIFHSKKFVIQEEISAFHPVFSIKLDDEAF